MRTALSLLSLVLALGPVARAGAGVVEDAKRRQALDHYRKGEKALLGEKFEQAAEAFGKAVELNPDFMLAYYGLGQSRMLLKQYPEAVTAFSAARDAYYKMANARVNDRMAAADVSQRMLDEYRNLTGVEGAGRGTSKGVNERLNVLRDIEQVKKMDDGNPEPPAEISLALAGAWFRQNNLEESEKENRNALKSKPDYGQAHSNLAVICLMTGRIPEAQAELEKAEKAGFTVNPRLKEELTKRSATQ